MSDAETYKLHSSAVHNAERFLRDEIKRLGIKPQHKPMVSFGGCRCDACERVHRNKMHKQRLAEKD